MMAVGAREPASPTAKELRWARFERDSFGRVVVSDRAWANQGGIFAPTAPTRQRQEVLYLDDGVQRTGPLGRVRREVIAPLQRTDLVNGVAVRIDSLQTS